jgi:hypothetical protein
MTSELPLEHPKILRRAQYIGKLRILRSCSHVVRFIDDSPSDRARNRTTRVYLTQLVSGDMKN